MQITLSGRTRLKEALDSIPGALEYIISLNPHDFKRLYNPFMRKYMSPRISLERVAAMAGVPLAEMLGKLQELAGEPQTGTANIASLPSNRPLPQSPAAPPDWMKLTESPDLHWINLLPLDKVMGDPLPPIVVAIKNMPPGGVIGLKHHWEPQPLYDIWQKMQLEWFTRQVGPEEWHIFVYKPLKILPSVQAPVIYTELRHLSLDEAGLRVALMFEQLQPGQVLEITGATQQTEGLVRQVLEKNCPGQYDWQSTLEGNKLVIRVTRRPDSKK